jgi:ornithine carbamoyltransferase
MRHFLKETDLSPAETAQVFAAAAALKAGRGRAAGAALAHQSWGLMFFKKSTRTRGARPSRTPPASFPVTSMAW